MKIDATKIVKLMRERNMRKVDLSKASGVEYNNLINALRRLSTSYDTASRLAAALGVDVAEIERKPVEINDDAIDEYIKEHSLLLFNKTVPISQNAKIALAKTLELCNAIDCLPVDDGLKCRIRKMLGEICTRIYNEGFIDGERKCIEK